MAEDVRKSETDTEERKSHYGEGVQPWDVIRDQHLNFAEGCVVKYVWRFGLKNGLDDLKKAKWYLQRLIEGAHMAEKSRHRYQGYRVEHLGLSYGMPAWRPDWGTGTMESDPYTPFRTADDRVSTILLAVQDYPLRCGRMVLDDAMRNLDNLMEFEEPL